MAPVIQKRLMNFSHEAQKGSLCSGDVSSDTLEVFGPSFNSTPIFQGVSGFSGEAEIQCLVVMSQLDNTMGCNAGVI